MLIRDSVARFIVTSTPDASVPDVLSEIVDVRGS
jgi:hypothetical protein